VCVAPGSVTSALEPLRMARKLDPYRETARMALEPWLVEAALARLTQPLSPADQRILHQLGVDRPSCEERHSATPLSARTAIIIESDESLTLSITNPLGTRDEIRMPARMVLIPPLENRKLGRKHHQI
jgi:hypothetical protein